ncbi:MAG: 16S rRNA (guanine(966)-N(2))-methyltransferase RsmD [Chloroflexi bacterium RBG_16_47_49]|nr:MAG: 16S rRNA (guanine(966)-N(2))-methyltransferase RsmD [Chloroflexi bacterium RBG_16_47_49]
MNELRIIGGKARGRKIKSVPGETTRPITDKVREALFNIISSDIQAATVLDLFAGTGSVGIEALSRGAKYVCFVDLNRQPISTIRENLKRIGLEEGAEVIRSDAFSFLEHPPSHKFDYVYIAPPQYNKLWCRALQNIDIHTAWLSGDAWVIVQIHPVEYLPIGEEMQIRNLIEFDQRHYGSTLLVFYRRTENDVDESLSADHQ